ncbi:MAG: hypothetical protein EKK46_09390 [Rhodocyclaceae bacterium]|nr:MAG: hypothetical protein EKK46_09390 [Rhodocyclaceae bacterium]
MSENLSGQQIAANNLQKFFAWIAERDATNDWTDYIRQGKLNRSELAAECGFALSVVRQNPAVKSALEALEARLLSTGILQPERTAPGAPMDAGTNATASPSTSESWPPRARPRRGSRRSKNRMRH